MLPESPNGGRSTLATGCWCGRAWPPGYCIPRARCRYPATLPPAEIWLKTQPERIRQGKSTLSENIAEKYWELPCVWAPTKIADLRKFMGMMVYTQIDAVIILHEYDRLGFSFWRMNDQVCLLPRWVSDFLRQVLHLPLDVVQDY